MSPGRQNKERDWYKVSVETLRGWGILILLVVLSGVGYVGYRIWERYAIQREAGQAIDEARALFQRLRGEGGEGNFKAEYDAAWAGIEEARTLYSEAKFDQALSKAERSREMLRSLLDASSNKGKDGGDAQFIAVQGRVEFRRADRGDWEQARGRVTLRPGDYVKTSAGGSAEIMFSDGTLYTVRPDTLFLVSAKTGGDEGKSIELQYGWINLNTAKSKNTVGTPNAEAVVADSSEAAVSYDGSKREGRFTAIRGNVEVASGGETRHLEALQTVAQAGTKLSEVKGLPAAPKLVSPLDNADVDIATQKEIKLVWDGVEGGERYALQISRNRLFVDNVIDAEDRRGTQATLGVQGEGAFLWRVAAISGDSLRGPWSAPGRFRVASSKAGGSSSAADKIPPEIEVQEIQSYGSIFIVSGHTEPGASVWVNGESVTVESDGNFTKTIQLAQQGWAFVDIRATDAWGNEATHRARVFVESL